jgi:hypothetical protein
MLIKTKDEDQEERRFNAGYNNIGNISNNFNINHSGEHREPFNITLANASRIINPKNKLKRSVYTI